MLIRLVSILIATFTVVASAAPTNPLIPTDKPWKVAVVDFANAHLKHSAWGVQHSERNFLLSSRLAKEANWTLDEDVLFAAAYLHDMGGGPEFAVEGVDHALRSAELVEGILFPAGFPKEKLDAVRGTIRAHTYYNPTLPVTQEETAFRNADVLDFMVAIGIVRIVSLTERESFAPDLLGAFRMLEKFPERMFSALVGDVAKKMGRQRASEMSATLEQLRQQSFGTRAS